jgi:hypothetical protein
MLTPPMVAMGTFFCGFSTTLATTAAVSTPMKAHRVMLRVP